MICVDNKCRRPCPNGVNVGQSCPRRNDENQEGSVLPLTCQRDPNNNNQRPYCSECTQDSDCASKFPSSPPGVKCKVGRCMWDRSCSDNIHCRDPNGRRPAGVCIHALGTCQRSCDESDVGVVCPKPTRDGQPAEQPELQDSRGPTCRQSSQNEFFCGECEVHADCKPTTFSESATNVECYRGRCRQMCQAPDDESNCEARIDRQREPSFTCSPESEGNLCVSKAF